MTRYTYDPFQQAAIDCINQGKSVIVSAPTGTGKTAIAEYVIEKSLEYGNRVIYTAPIKALSNQKYRDFGVLYGDRIGIVTGDVAINPRAPVLIMTTEIFRNTLFEDPSRLADVKWLIFDEIHYLDDAERGTVWEESILFCPSGVSILGLSATVPNIDEIAQWIRTILGREIEVVVETKRPVPLHFLFQSQNRVVDSLEDLKRMSYRGMTSKKKRRNRRHGSYYLHQKVKPNRLQDLVKHLHQTQRLPCIYFCFGRRRCEHLAWELRHSNLLDKGEEEKMTRLFTVLSQRFNLEHDQTIQKLHGLVRHGVAYHHAGMLPRVKEVVECLFTSRLIKLIVTTETFALGINMPARSVAFDELSKSYGTHYGTLTTRDFYQMAGRAGRRGIDKRGFVYSRINPYRVDYEEIIHIIHGRPEKVRSQFNSSYATILHLFRELKADLVTLYPSSLHSFQASRRERKKGTLIIQRKLQLLRDMGYIAGDELTPKGEFAGRMYGHELSLAELHEQGYLERLKEAELCMLISALIYEPRKGEHRPHFPPVLRAMAKDVNRIAKDIRKKETKLGIPSSTKRFFFHIAPAIKAWFHGASFEETLTATLCDEGELVRYFRMTIQVFRNLLTAPRVSQELSEKSRRCLQALKRDIIDAEQELREEVEVLADDAVGRL